MKRRGGWVLWLMVLAGCVSVEAPQFERSERVEEFSVPAINSLATANVGDPLISQGIRVQSEAIKLNAAYRTEWVRNSGGRAFPFTFEVGTVLSHIGSMKGVPLYVGKASGGLFDSSGRQLGTPYGLAVDSTEYVKFVYVGGGVVPETPKRKILFTPTILERVDKKNFRQELLYNGRNAKEIFFTYREFSNNLSRPAFTQNIRYMLGTEKIIGFKSLRIEIVKASSQDITYIVRQGF